jgi:hypothetical protein
MFKVRKAVGIYIVIGKKLKEVVIHKDFLYSFYIEFFNGLSLCSFSTINILSLSYKSSW